VHQDYSGFQVGADLAKLNLGASGGNLHFGITAGSVFAKAKDTTSAGGDYPAQPGDVRSHFDVPFVGLYTAYIQGNFFADAQVRWDFYESSSSSRIFDYSGVKNDARGLALTGSLGYRIPLVSDWFIEPSVGASWSRVKVDPVALIDSAGPFTGDGALFALMTSTACLAGPAFALAPTSCRVLTFGSRSFPPVLFVNSRARSLRQRRWSSPAQPSTA
jgi:hypothetical protein